MAACCLLALIRQDLLHDAHLCHLLGSMDHIRHLVIIALEISQEW